MTIVRARFWLLSGLNGAAALALVLFALQKIPATMYWVSDGIALLTIMAAFGLIPIGAAAVMVLGRWTRAPRPRRHEDKPPHPDPRRTALAILAALQGRRRSSGLRMFDAAMRPS